MVLRLLKHPLLWIVIIVVGCYFTSDILEAGHTLNSSFPQLYLGWGFWVCVVFLLWMILFAPLLSFLSLPRWVDVTTATESQQLQHLTRYAKKMVATGREIERKASSDEDKAEIQQATTALLNAYMANIPLDQKVKGLHLAVHDFREMLKKKALAKVIRKYVLCAGGAVILSRKSMVDALFIFGLQIKLIIDLSRELGHKPSWAFITCCLAWVIANSLFMTLLEESNIASVIGSSLGEITGGKFVDLLQDTPFLKSLGKQTAESLYAGATLYVTGILVLRRLMGESRRLKPAELLKLRWEGLTQAKYLVKE